MNVVDFPKLSFRNKESLLALKPTESCSCYFCLKNFLVGDLSEWTDNQETALCPFCNIDAIVPGKLSKEELIGAFQRWFCTPVSKEDSDKIHDSVRRSLKELDINKKSEVL